MTKQTVLALDDHKGLLAPDRWLGPRSGL